MFREKFGKNENGKLDILNEKALTLLKDLELLNLIKLREGK